jgi:hypothetical protein
MGKQFRERDHVFAVIRIDGPFDTGTDIQHRVTVKEVVRDLGIAQAEVDRLNTLNQDKKCKYFWQATRLFPAGDSFGTHEVDQLES